MKKTLLLKLLTCVIAAALLLPLAGCRGNDKTADDGSLKKVLDAGQLILGLDTEFPPMGFIDGNGEIVGFDIDVAEEVCKRLGVKLVKQPIVWENKENDLNNGVIDCIWNGMSVTEERSKNMNLSDPYMKNELRFVVHGSSSVKRMRDLAGKTVGVQSGSTALDVLKKSDIYADITVKEYADNNSILKCLQEGEIDAAFVDSVIAYYFINSSTDRFFTLPDILSEEDYAVGFRKEDKTLRNKVQEILKAMKSDGTLGEISKKWFGSDITTVR